MRVRVRLRERCRGMRGVDRKKEREDPSPED